MLSICINAVVLVVSPSDFHCLQPVHQSLPVCMPVNLTGQYMPAAVALLLLAAYYISKLGAALWEEGSKLEQTFVWMCRVCQRV